jgi:hypothetical protein
MYYLPEEIFLSWFKYFAQWLDFGAWGVGGAKLTVCYASIEPHCIEKQGAEGINNIWGQLGPNMTC